VSTTRFSQFSTPVTSYKLPTAIKQHRFGNPFDVPCLLISATNASQFLSVQQSLAARDNRLNWLAMQPYLPSAGANQCPQIRFPETLLSAVCAH